MDSDKLLRIMKSEGLETTVESTSYDWSTRKFGFGYGFQLYRPGIYQMPVEETHRIFFDDIEEFKEMTQEQVIAEISKVRQELLLKIHFHSYFKKFCMMSAQEQARSYKSFLECISNE